MTALCLPASIDAAAAVRFFSKPRFFNLFGLLALRGIRIACGEDPASRTPPFVERFWMPAYAVRVHTTSRKGQSQVWTAVDAISGAFSLLECDGELAERELDGEAFPAVIDKAQAAELARHGAMHYILIQRGLMNKPVVDAVGLVRPYWHPVWACYVPRRGRLDIRVQDARTGKSGGPKMRIAVINAIIAAHREYKGAR